MDALPLYKRADALSFSNAMTALEGLEARNETMQDLKSWINGMVSFADIYIPILKMEIYTLREYISITTLKK